MHLITPYLCVCGEANQTCWEKLRLYATSDHRPNQTKRPKRPYQNVNGPQTTTRIQRSTVQGASSPMSPMCALISHASYDQWSLTTPSTSTAPALRGGASRGRTSAPAQETKLIHSCRETKENRVATESTMNAVNMIVPCADHGSVVHLL